VLQSGTSVPALHPTPLPIPAKMTSQSHASSRETPTPYAGASPTADNAVLGHAVQHGLRVPINSLRTSMENLRSEFAGAPLGDHALSEVLAEVNRLGRNVQALLDYAFQPTINALECSVNEIVYTARFHVPFAMRSSLWIARDRDLPELNVDGPVLSRSIARLIEASTPLAQNGVLLNVKRTEMGISFSVTYQATAGHLGDPTGLGHAIASRDLAAIGCPMLETTSHSGDTTMVINVQSAMLLEPAA
jgi:hypothetical protein